MPLFYETPLQGSLRQGELLNGVYERRVTTIPAKRRDEDAPVHADSYEHPFILTLTSWCDLLRDYETRDTAAPKMSDRLNYVLACIVYEEGTISKSLDRGLFKRIQRNRDPRYHRIEAARIPGGDELPDLFLDFKCYLAVPLAGLYDAIKEGSVKRVAVIGPLYREEIIQRFYNFHSRVSLPDD